MKNKSWIDRKSGAYNIFISGGRKKNFLEFIDKYDLIWWYLFLVVIILCIYYLGVF